MGARTPLSTDHSCARAAVFAFPEMPEKVVLEHRSEHALRTTANKMASRELATRCFGYMVLICDVTTGIIDYQRQF